MDSLLECVVVVGEDGVGQVLGGWLGGVPTAAGRLLERFLRGQNPFLEGKELLEEGVVWTNLHKLRITIFLLPFTMPIALWRVIPFALIRKAKTREALLETPAMQCTSTFVLFNY